MSQVKWLIEADVFGRSSEPVKAEIRAQGMSYEVVHARPFLNGVVPDFGGQKLGNEDCVVFWGSPPLMHHLRKNYSWCPGGWCHFDHLNCEEYYPRIKSDCLLNFDCRFGSIDELQQDENRIFARFARDAKVFVRPCTLEKVFTGQLVTQEDYCWTLERARYANCRLLVSQPVPISCEWRIIMNRSVPIAASQYRRRGEIQIQPGCPESVMQFMTEAWSNAEWFPDELFVVDVCESNNDLSIVELNSFSCSGWYECDPQAVVAKASELALKNFQDRTTPES